MIKFSIVIPCFNAAETLPETLASLADQTCEDWEAICVDDGSTDGTFDLIARAAARDRRIRAVRNRGKGPSRARNLGVALAKGDLIAFCDADDLFAPTKLMQLDAVFGCLGADAVFGRVAFFSKTPGDSGVTSAAPAGPLSVADLLGENPTCTLSNLAVRRDVFLATGGFAADMAHNEDLDWLIRLCGSGAKVIGLPSILVHYRTSPAGLSSDFAAMAEGRRRALASARALGFAPGRAAEATHLRYLARRALRLDDPAALRLVLCGVAQSPSAFLFPLRRGLATLVAAFAAPLMPRDLRRALFRR